MKRHLFLAASVATIALLVASVPRAQMRVAPIDEDHGHVALGLALRHLGNAGIFMMATAHPDDEDNGMLVMLNRGEGYRTALASATRGNGGQNEIGPEIFESLAVLRTDELAAMHRFDGAEQYFTRAVDFGYSISIEETFEKWGRDETVGDYVRLIRTVRPDVVTAMTPTATGPGQHQHHTASAVLAREAFLAAGDPNRYPEQIREGLRPWQPKKLYYRMFGGAQPAAPAKFLRPDLAQYDSLLGKTYSEIGTEARSMHKCQGQAQLLALPGPSLQTYVLWESALPGGASADDKGLFDGIDTSIPGLTRFAGAKPPKELAEGLTAIATNVRAAQKKFEESDEATLQPLLAGLRGVRSLRSQLRSLSMDDAARYEIDARLRQKEREFQQAVLVANGLRIEALADDGVVVPGQPLKVAVIVANRGGSPVTVKQVKFDGFDGDGACSLAAAGAAGGGGGGRGGAAAPAPAAAMTSFGKGQVGRCEPTLKIPAQARPSEPYWHRDGMAGRYTFDADAPFGLPYRPTPFYVQVTLTVAGGEEVIAGQPVQYRYEGNIFSGEKRSDLLVVPALSVRVSPDIAIVPAVSLRPAVPAAKAKGTAPVEAPSGTREVRVTVVNDTPGAADTVVKLELPRAWVATPPEQVVTFTRQDESQTVRFAVKPSATAAPGQYDVKAVATLGGQRFDRGYQVIEYAHIRRQHIYDAATVALKIIDVKTAPNLTIGYIMGAGDQVPSALEQLGVKVEMLGPEGLAWGDLTRYDAVMTGVRAYERRPDLRANNQRLLDYVKNGGTFIVQYFRVQPGNPDYGPYPGHVTNDRVTDEFAPVQVLEPAHPIFNVPNKIAEQAWSGWVQERGLNFFSEKDSRYKDLVQLEDPFPNNPGVKRGGLVEASYGKGRWVYIGLGLWRELPAGVDGAYQLMANIVSLGKAQGTAAKGK